MPNWCMNHVSVSSSDPATINRFREAVEKTGEKLGLFSQLCPIQKPDESDARINWGTKWDVHGVALINNNSTVVDIEFFTAWSPPIEFYQHLTKQGYHVEAMYYEGGVGFCGYWDSEKGDVEIDLTDGTAIPSDIQEMFGLENEE